MKLSNSIRALYSKYKNNLRIVWLTGIALIWILKANQEMLNTIIENDWWVSFSQMKAKDRATLEKLLTIDPEKNITSLRHWTSKRLHNFDNWTILNMNDSWIPFANTGWVMTHWWNYDTNWDWRVDADEVWKALEDMLESHTRN